MDWYLQGIRASQSPCPPSVKKVLKPTRTSPLICLWDCHNWRFRSSTSQECCKESLLKRYWCIPSHLLLRNRFVPRMFPETQNCIQNSYFSTWRFSTSQKPTSFPAGTIWFTQFHLHIILQGLLNFHKRSSKICIPCRGLFSCLLMSSVHTWCLPCTYHTICRNNSSLLGISCL